MAENQSFGGRNWITYDGPITTGLRTARHAVRVHLSLNVVTNGARPERLGSVRLSVAFRLGYVVVAHALVLPLVLVVLLGGVVVKGSSDDHVGSVVEVEQHGLERPLLLRHVAPPSGDPGAALAHRRGNGSPPLYRPSRR